MPYITKKEVLDAANRGEGCLGKAADDEPVFVLVGKDAFAPSAIHTWITKVSEYAPGRGGKIDDANAVFGAILDWQGKHPTKIPD